MKIQAKTASGAGVSATVAAFCTVVAVFGPAGAVKAEIAPHVAGAEIVRTENLHGAAESAVVDRDAPDFAVMIARRMTDDGRIVAGRTIDIDRLRRIYAERGFNPLWIGASAAFTPAAAAAVHVLQDAEREGLIPAHYHADALTPPVAAAPATPAADAPAADAADARLSLELLLTDGLLRYARDVRAGRIAPRKLSRDFDVDQPAVDAPAAVARIAAAADPAAALAALAPTNADYRGLRDALAALRYAERNGGWPVVPAFRGKTKLEPGASDPAVPVLRDRLTASGDYAGQRGKSSVYDAPLRAAVVKFQTRHGLEATGAVDAGTLAEINEPTSARIARTLANMERARWMPDDFGDRYVKVNVPEFTLRAVDLQAAGGGATTQTMRVVVGAKQRKTPIMASTIPSVVLNPTWTMPPRLAKEDYLPKLQKNPGYLTENGFTVYPSWDAAAKPLDARKINWKSYSPAAMSRLKLRQDPGPKNALGQIKFNIVNDMDIYLHDTPSRDKFQRSMRALSSGCVRLGDPMALADFIFAGMPEWNAENRKPVLDGMKTRHVALKRPTPVYILYQTAWVDDGGLLHFRPDIYDRDPELLNAVAKAGPSTPAFRTAMNGG